ncbi:MAG: sensor histidine kinase [Rhodanobacteraceae bacterium]
MEQTEQSLFDTACLAAASPPDQLARLAALRSYAILDTPIEAAFEDITRIAAIVCKTPIAVVNLVDEARQWFKSEIGLGVRETPLDTSICAHAILLNDFMEIPDTRLDPRFARNPLVTGAPHLRFYAGALLRTPEGHALGTVCVLDAQPRTLSDEQRATLRALARQTMAQLELRRALRHSDQVNRLRGRLMAIAGHDLRQPLSVMTLMLDLLARKLSQPTDLQHIELARQAAHRLSRDLHDLAEASQAEEERDSFTFQSVNLGQFLATLVDTWMDVARRKGLELKLGPIDVVVRSDPTALRSIVDNLISNAIKYTAHGWVKVECRNDDDGTWIDVEDTGPGIPPQLRGEIFEAFRQLDPDAEGLGLGLSIVKSTADMLGYAVRLTSEAGAGATFSVCLPQSGTSAILP